MSTAIRGKNDMRNVVILIIAVLVLLLPFITKPFNVDDPFYLKAAQQVLKDPLRPYSFTINWSGELRDVWQRREATFPPLVPFYTASLVKCFGESELALHLGFLIFPLCAVLSMYLLARRFVRNPLLPAILLAGSPAFLVSSTSIMLDVPLIALMLASLCSFLYGVDADNKKLLTAGAVLAGCALLAKYSAFLLVPLLVLAVVMSGKRKYLKYALVPLVFFAAWCAHNLAVYGELHLVAASQNVGSGLSIHKLMGLGTFFTGCFLFPLAAPACARKWDGAVLAGVFAAAGILAALLFGTAIMPLVLFAVLCGTTLFFLYKVAGRAKGEDRFLLAWFVLALALVVCLEPWISGRYLLIVLPPAALLFAKMLEEARGGKAARIIGAVAVAVTLFFGAALTVADYEWANAYPQFAQYVERKNYRPGCFAGHFGLQYYLEKAGLVAFEVNRPETCRGYFIAARIPDPQRPSPSFMKGLRMIDYQAPKSAFPVRLMDPRHGAGFYSSFWGIFPFVFSTAPLDDFAVFSVHEK